MLASARVSAPHVFSSTYRLTATATRSLVAHNVIRTYAAHAKHYDAVVIGGGPGGMTVCGNLLDQGLESIAMVDDMDFTAGRINQKYREVPSNTKTSMFDKWATGTFAFKKALQRRSPTNNAYDKMLTFDQNAGCLLGDAIDVAKLISDGLRADARVTAIAGHAQVLDKTGSSWSLPEFDVRTDRVVLAVGSHPRPHNLAERYPHLTAVHLDTALKPSVLKNAIPRGSRVGVVGSSHSAVLALKHLCELPIQVVNFYRSELLFAEYEEGWIRYDNTGIKGVAADWARNVLASSDLPSNLRRVNVKRDEDQVYDSELKHCTHLCSAIGYKQNPLPTITVDGKQVEPEFDPLTGRFFRAKGHEQVLPGLFGAGIAYPNRVTDPEGNVESAVGWFKFHKFLGRVAPEWVANP
jgi:thioredoxin reductase